MTTVNSGVYRIVNTITGRTYIGSSCQVEKRLGIHLWSLSVGKHSNRHLQSSWKKYGKASFTTEQLITCERSVLAVREQEFIDAYIKNDMPLYNIKPSAESRASFRYKATQETVEKQRAAIRGRKLPARSEEYRKKMSEALKGRIFTPEHIAKIQATRAGYKHSLETKAKMSSKSKGNKRRLGKKHSLETRAKMSMAHKDTYRKKILPTSTLTTV